MVELILRTERNVAAVRETQTQSFVLIRDVVQIDVENEPLSLLSPCSVPPAYHVEKGERAEAVPGRTGHQRDGVQALSLNLHGQDSQSSRRGGLARKVQT